MDAWPGFERACLDRHGVGDVELARAHGVSRARYFERTARDAWARPLPGIRIHPEAPPSVQQRLVVVCLSSHDLAAASGTSAAWLHGLRDRPPDRPSVLGRHATRCRACCGVAVRRARWLEPDDVTTAQQVPTLAVPAMLVSLGTSARNELRGCLIDAVHRRLTATAEVLDRLARIGPVPGRGVLRELCHELGRLVVESVFQDDVAADLERLGYRPERSVWHVDTPDGIGLRIDIALRIWKVAVEPEGDAYHRSREQRRLDRRRAAAFAGIDWVRVPVDWRDWHLDRESVLRAIDAAIAAQRRRGIGIDTPPPRLFSPPTRPA